MRELFDSMSEGFAYHRIVVDGSGKPVDYVFLDVNPAFSNITGLGMDVVGRRATEVLPGIEKDPADWIGVYGKVALSRQAVTFEKYSTNLKKWYSVSAYSPSTMHFATLFIDVTKRKEMELEVARSNSELQQFAYISSHDLQEPLRMVSSYLRLLERRYGDKLDDQAKEYIGYAVDGARHMKELIDDLLAYSRLQAEPRPMRTCDLNKVCARAIENLGDAVSRNTATITVEPLPTVKADEVQMVQLFQNLLSNAVKFHHGEGPNVKVRATEGADAWTLSVQDDGIGIEPQYHQRIFEMFSRLHPRDEYEGTGIGLAVARRIVERHGGRIWVESEGMHGSTFFFTLPKNGKSG
jgi:light-regulated signal transduction histidine kinase (bacteriophytochrome)